MKFIDAKSKVKTETFKSTCLFNTLEGIPVLEKMCQRKLQDATLAGEGAVAAQKHLNQPWDLPSLDSVCCWFGNAGVKPPRCLRASGCTMMLQLHSLIPDAIVRWEKQSNRFIRSLK